MNINTTSELLNFCVSSILLGTIFHILYFATNSVLFLLKEYISFAKRTWRDGTNNITFVKFNINQMKKKICFAPFNVIFIIICSLFYSVLNYIYLDGCFRVLPIICCFVGFFVFFPFSGWLFPLFRLVDFSVFVIMGTLNLAILGFRKFILIFYKLFCRIKKIFFSRLENNIS